jgi:hypothetical protein
MPTNHVFNPNQSRVFDAPVRRIDVAVGSLVITDGHDSKVVQETESYECDPTPMLSAFSPKGARVSVTYGDEPEVAVTETSAERGDTGGATGSYESRTVKELQKLAKEREIKGYSDLTKDELIETLRD